MTKCDTVSQEVPSAGAEVQMTQRMTQGTNDTMYPDDTACSNRKKQTGCREDSQNVGF